MGLFADGPLSTIEDLSAQDSSVLEVAGTEGIDLTQKLVLAQDELGVELTALLPDSSDGGGAGLENVVVTAPLKLWHVFRTLALVYRDAYNRELNDRYEGRRNQFTELARWAYEKLLQTGVGLVWDPVPQAEAPALGLAPGSMADEFVFASVAWVNAAGEEGAAGVAKPITVPAGNTVTVTPTEAPENARAWNVFLGPGPENLVQQNTGAIAAGQIWVQTRPVLSSGRAPGSGQAPNCVRALPRVLQRG